MTTLYEKMEGCWADVDEFVNWWKTLVLCTEDRDTIDDSHPRDLGWSQVMLRELSHEEIDTLWARFQIEQGE